MRYREWQPIITADGQSDLFRAPKRAAFIRYLGASKAKVYVRNFGFVRVRISQIQPEEMAVQA
jgi:hypothetical protein